LSYDISPNVTASVWWGGVQSNIMQPGWYRTWNFTPPAGYAGSIPAGLDEFFDSGIQDPNQQGSSMLEEKLNVRLGVGTLQIAALQNRSFETQYISEPQIQTMQLWGGGAFGTSSNNTPVIFNGGTYTVNALGPDIYNETGWADNRDVSFRYTFPFGQTGEAGFSYVSQYYENPTWVYSAYDGTASTTNYYYGDYFNSGETRLFVQGDIAPRLWAGLSEYMTSVVYHVNDPNDATSFIDKPFGYSAPRLGLVWRPTTNVAIRGAAGGGFAAAPLYQLTGTNGPPTPSTPPGSYSTTLTNTDLRPEESFGWDLGTDIRLRHGEVISFDAYRTNLYGQFYETTQLNGMYSGYPLFVTQYGNLGVSRYEGLILDVNKQPARGWYWHVSGGFTRAFVVSVPPGFYDSPPTCTMCANVSVVTNVNFNGTFDTPVPYSQAFGSIGYRWSPEKYVDVQSTYFGPNNSYFRPAFIVTDLLAGYPLTKHVSLLLTFRNVFNQYGAGNQIYTPDTMIGAPTVAGGPYGLIPENYGPRALLVTTNLNL
jgi:outer membrane receptor protein involved in Fe transport